MDTLDTTDLWKTTLAQIEIKLDSQAHFKTWFAPTELVSIDGNRATIGVKNSYASDWLKKKHNDLIQNTLSHVAGKDLELTFVISKNASELNSPKITTADTAQESILNVKEGVNVNFENLIQQSNLNPNYSFSTFVVGPSNRLAQAASLAVSKNPGSTYNPLFIHGGTGLGKTHLANAVAQKILESNPGKKIYYTPSENFLNEMVSSIRTGKTKEFRNKYRFLDLIIIDDIQMISKWEQTQDELFNTFNALHSKNKQIILISDRPPEKIHNLESRLKSRFMGGLVVQVEKPDFETRLAILEHKAKSLGISLPDKIIEYIAKNVSDNVRVLEGNMQQIALYNQLHTSEITVAEVANLLGTDQRSKREKIKPPQIIKIVAKEFSVTSKDIIGITRKADIAFARQVVMYFLREDFGYKLEDIAKTLNRKDHTTVIHALDKIKSKIKIDDGFAEQISEIRNQF